jgi:protein TonB
VHAALGGTLALFPASERPAREAWTAPLALRWVLVAEAHDAQAAPAQHRDPASPAALVAQRPEAQRRRTTPPALRAPVHSVVPAAFSEPSAARAEQQEPVMQASSEIRDPGQPSTAASSDGASAASLPAELRGGYQVRPVYPRAARLRGAQGTTLLRVLVSRAGAVQEAQVETTSQDADLDRAALAAVRRWRFEPLAVASGEGVWVRIPIEFRLHGSEEGHEEDPREPGGSPP